MDEFTSIAVWVLMTYLAINAAIIWFDSSTTFQTMGVTTGINQDNSFTENDMNSIKSLFGLDCSLVSPSDLINTTSCGLSQLYYGTTEFLGGFWNLLTAWTKLFDVIFTPLGEIGELLKNILIPFFSLVQLAAILFLLLRFVGVIRGGS